MPPKDHYGVQTFVTDRKGRLARGLAVACKNADEARREAERRASGRSAIGATAFWRSASGEFDESAEPITLAVYGTVPPGVEDTLPF
jgi:hypothetical protein